ncbi:MAG: hypothetical protein GX245_07380 [Eubacteriaceae bacterium]|nr:hypothetical protein [Eubacteriaceae bacterium]
MKKIITISLLVLLLLATSISTFAAPSDDSPADILSDLTNRPVESLVQERAATQTTYGAMAKAAGVSEQFREKVMILKEARLAQRVADQTMTQEQANAILAQLQKRQATCDGTCDDTCDTPQRLMQQQNAGGGLGQGKNFQQGGGPRDGTGNGNGFQRGNGANSK